ncbi:MAG: exodeoxyribonuclease V subunit gamma [Deltaproteobacteria bacterium RIFOXYD12_FULL_57_12]|nr:MAG: exodeoxyribonuclease V subunit gamma [Deltaproteobacteria bacterium RIFOXYD12_FULL_57_12]
MTAINGNRLELLAEQLAEILHNYPAPPLFPETIVIQNPGMARWLAQTLADRLGIWANSRFPLPNAFFRDVMKQLVSGQPEISSYRKELLTWHLMDLLPTLAGKKTFAAVNSYLRDGLECKPYQLAVRLAEMFDRYLLFRPDMISAWEKNGPSNSDHEKWQSELWRELIRRIDKHKKNDLHPARLLENCLAILQNRNFAAGLLPPRITVFGVSSLPPSYLRLLAGLANHTDVSLFFMNPCREFWDDIASDLVISKKERAARTNSELLYLERGNSLLASLGQVGQEFLTMLHELDVDEQPLFAKPGGSHLLAAIQTDILSLADRGATRQEPDSISDTNSQTPSAMPVAVADDSITVHVCHSPWREVEVLHDYLLGVFDRNQQIEPRHVLVLTPDIETYAPLIQAVFDNPAPGCPKIPYSIATGSARLSHRLIDPFFALLKLPGSRLTAARIMELIEAPAVHQRFALAADNLELIRNWIDESRIRWGVDQESRRRLALPAFAQNSWRAGIDRLLLGYAMAAAPERMFAGILPHGGIEGSDAVLLGRFLDFCECLFRHVQRLEKPQSLTAWSATLTTLLEECFQVDEETATESQFLRALFQELPVGQEITGFGQPVGLDVIRTHLLRAVEQNSPETATGPTGLLTGGVTFTAMHTLRSVPFAIICLLGMNDNVLPRPDQNLSFDLMAAKRQRGDRSQRLDDRYLFLETLLAARQKLSISYVGQSIRDDTLLPPSVLVSELLDYIDQGFQAADGSIREQITTHHKLHPFHPDYFKTEEIACSKLFSYADDNCRAADILRQKTKITEKPLLTSRLVEPPDACRRLTIDRLCLFFQQPARFFLTQQLAIHLAPSRDALDETEPFTTTGLDRYRLAEQMLQRKLDGQEITPYLLAKKAGGELPYGRSAGIVFQEILTEIDGLTEKLKKIDLGERIAPEELALEIDEFQVCGWLEEIRQQGLLFYRAGMLRPKDRLRAWIRHLLHNAFLEQDANQPPAAVTILADRKSLYRYRPPTQPRELLATLLRLYWQGQSAPLAFLPASSFAYAEKMQNRLAEPEAMRQARLAWYGDDHRPAERDDPYFRLCYGDTDPLQDAGFQELALAVYNPLLTHQEKIS